MHALSYQKNLLARASDRVRKKVKIVRDFGGKLCRTKSRLCRILCGIVQFCAEQNIWSPTPYQSKH